ncbi:MAG TPA: hotdog fold thioesterase [Actinobacteria bacterium]|nr:hotdog fold thioesterase [Actinomycetota bacterium]
MDRADRIRELFATDPYVRHLGLELVDTEPVTVAMTLDERHANFHGAAHGGAVFSLADCAFSLASNAASPAVGIDTHVAFLAPARIGDRLVAVATEVHRGRTLGTYEVAVSRGDDRLCAVFTGTVAIRP